ncbi:MAG: hypothetical protein ABIB04_00860 [Patescibacteria group bacterium]
MPINGQAPINEQAPDTDYEPSTQIKDMGEMGTVSENADTLAQPSLDPNTEIMVKNTEVKVATEVESNPVTAQPLSEEPIPETMRSSQFLDAAGNPYEPVVESGIRPIAEKEGMQSQVAQEEIVMTVEGNNPVPPDMSKPPHVPSILNPEEEMTGEEKENAA